MKTYQIIYYTILAGAILLALARYKKLSLSSKWSAALLLATLASELTAHLYRLHYSNFPIYHFFIPIQFGLVCQSFFSEVRFSFNNMLVVTFAVFCVVVGLTIQPLNSFPSLTNLTGSFITIILSLVYLRKLLDNPSESSLLTYPMFWISCGWLFFNTLTLFHFGAYNFLLSKQSDLTYQVLRNMKIGSNYLLYSCYIIAFLTPQKILVSNIIRNDKH